MNQPFSIGCSAMPLMASKSTLLWSTIGLLKSLPLLSLPFMLQDLLPAMLSPIFPHLDVLYQRNQFIRGCDLWLAWQKVISSGRKNFCDQGKILTGNTSKLPFLLNFRCFWLSQVCQSPLWPVTSMTFHFNLRACDPWLTNWLCWYSSASHLSTPSVLTHNIKIINYWPLDLVKVKAEPAPKLLIYDGGSLLDHDMMRGEEWEAVINSPLKGRKQATSEVSSLLVI